MEEQYLALPEAGLRFLLQNCLNLQIFLLYLRTNLEDSANFNRREDEIHQRDLSILVRIDAVTAPL
jgi:hypothetical protein